MKIGLVRCKCGRLKQPGFICDFCYSEEDGRDSPARTCRICGSWAEDGMCVSCAVDRAESADDFDPHRPRCSLCGRYHYGGCC